MNEEKFKNKLRKRYRIITNGKVFRVEYKYDYFIFFSYWDTTYRFLTDYATKEEAEKYIEEHINNLYIEMLENQWKVVK